MRLLNLDAVEDQMKKALARLRAKTDRELGILAEKQLEQTLALVEIGRHCEAAREYDRIRKMLAVASLPAHQRERVDAQLARVRAVIEMPAGAVA
jgi:hypothetical protein